MFCMEEYCCTYIIAHYTYSYGKNSSKHLAFSPGSCSVVKVTSCVMLAPVTKL